MTYASPMGHGTKEKKKAKDNIPGSAANRPSWQRILKGLGLSLQYYIQNC